MDYGSFRRMPYRLHRPWLRGTERAPLVLFLHGAGERGTDNEAQVGYRFFDTLAKQPYYILAPQCPTDDAWTAVHKWSDPVVTFQAQPSPALATALELMDFVIREERIEQQRIAIAGLSMGAFGCLDAIARRPESFAAAVAVCGNGDPKAAKTMARVPFWLAHGAEDPLVSVRGSETMAKALRDAGCDVTFKRLPGVGHDAWDPAFSDSELLHWLSRRLG